MPRPRRRIVESVVYHVLNRGNGRMTLFHKDGDYLAFLRVLGEGLSRYPVDLLDWCLMPNHWHLVLRPRKSAALTGLMRWISVTHVRRHHAHYHTRGGGHLYQGRFKSFPIEADRHFLQVCRYVESNALRAGLVKRAEDWPWCSLGWPERAPRVPRELRPDLEIAAWPVKQPRDWGKLVNERLPEKAVGALRTSMERGRPFGGEQWVTDTAKRLQLENTIRPPGRPRKAVTQRNQ